MRIAYLSVCLKDNGYDRDVTLNTIRWGICVYRWAFGIIIADLWNDTATKTI
jgi:hypothetical protein